MAVRIGVDVGGTFTKAVACDSDTGRVVARSVVPTTHAASDGVAAGVVETIAAIAKEVEREGLGPIQLVAHSTTQAVNALLEGDTAVVGILGIGRRPDLRRVRRRTEVGEVTLAPGRKLSTRHLLVDASDGLERPDVIAAVRSLLDRGAEVICASEAFGIEDARSEWLTLEVAADMGVAACAGHELSGLYGLEMRTVTGALNASILPTALRTARLVEEAVERDIPGVPLLVMRGDGGAADIRSMKRHPLVTAFSGPAASVAGALRHLSVRDGVVVEVGGTSTNVSVIKGGRPVLSYVRVLDHVTCVRSMDVRVVGVAGGSLVRLTRRLGRLRVADVGPRSAHIAGLRYASFEPIETFDGAKVRLIAPRPGDPPEYAVIETTDGQRLAPTVTCAANALGLVPDGAYAISDAASARRAFELIAEVTGGTWEAAARAVVSAAASKVAHVVGDACRENDLAACQMVGLGGGAGAVVPAVADMLNTQWSIPEDAEVISSVGDALSLIRIEVERALPEASSAAIAEVHRAAEAAAVDAGAAPSTIQVESEAVPERRALRAIAYGSVAMGTEPAGTTDVPLGTIADGVLGSGADRVAENPFYSVFTKEEAFVVLDRRGSVAAHGKGVVLTGSGSEVAAGLQERLPTFVRHFGPIAVAPAMRVLRGPRLVDLSLLSSPDAATEAALAECSMGYDEDVVAFISRS